MMTEYYNIPVNVFYCFYRSYLRNPQITQENGCKRAPLFLNKKEEKIIKEKLGNYT